MNLSVGASGEFTCSQSFFAKVVSTEVDHCSDPTIIMYCPDTMVLIHFRAPAFGFSYPILPLYSIQWSVYYLKCSLDRMTHVHFETSAFG
jgi:hypothetical protein